MEYNIDHLKGKDPEEIRDFCIEAIDPKKPKDWDRVEECVEIIYWHDPTLDPEDPDTSVACVRAKDGWICGYY